MKGFSKIKKGIAGLLACAMFTMQLTGCGSSGENKESVVNPGKESVQSTENNQAGKDDAQNAATPGEKEKFVIALPQNSNVENYDTNYLTRMLEEEFNVDLEFMLLPATAEDAKTKFTVMATSGVDLPDVVLMTFSTVEQLELGGAGVFVPLNEYINDPEVGVYFNQIPEEHKDMFITDTTMPDGNIYGLAAYNDEAHGTSPYLLHINKTWLNKLGLQSPKTTDDFYNVIKAFVTQDPNGNGKADEIGITGGTQTNSGGTNIIITLLNAFIYYRGANQLELNEEGKIYAPFTDEAFKEGLEYLHKLCSEGLLSPSVFTQDLNQLKAILANETQLVGCVSTLSNGLWGSDALNKSANYQDMEIIAPLTGPNGVSTIAQSRRKANAVWFITSSCKNPELAFRIGDFFYKFETTISMRFGEEGVNWSTDPTIAADYAEPAGGGEYAVKIAIMDHAWAKVQNVHWYAQGPRYNPRLYTSGVTTSSKEKAAENNKIYEKLGLKGQAIVYELEYYIDNCPAMPPAFIYTSDEIDKIGEIKTNVQTYVEQFIAEVVTGAKDISEWDNYISQLDKMGLQKWIEVDQAVYERMTN